MKININKNLLNKFIIAIFLINTIGPLPVSYAASKNNNHLNLPEPGIMVKLSESFEPLLIKGMTIDLKDPMSFDFIIDTGNSSYQKEDIKQQTQKLIKFFLTSMTVPKDDLWVNLSPYEKDKIIPEVLEKTELGRELLAQDYLLKQITSSLMFPEEELGETFWKKVYAKAREQFGTTDIPLNTFNKVWILPDTANIYEHKNTVYIMDGKLKVMLEEDYVALKENKVFELDKEKKTQAEDVASVSSEIVREIIIPELEQEVNNGKNFAPLRQIYYSLILAEWFKQTLKSSILSKVYADKNKLVGINNPEEEFKNKIYNQYLEAFKKGVYNYIKEECDSETQQIIPRKYFAGGFANEGVAFRKHGDKAMTAQRKEKIRPTGKSLKVNTTINPGFSNKENVNLIIESGSDQFNAAVARMQGDVFLKKQLASIEEVLEGNLIIKEGELVEKYGEANVAYAHGNDNIARHIGGVEMTIDTRELDNIEEILDILTHEIVETQVVAQLVKSNKITIEELNLLQKSGYQDWLTGLKLYYETEELSPLMIAKIGFDYVKTGLNLEEMSADILKILEKAGEEKEFSMHLNSFRKAPGEIKKLALTEFARDLGNPQRFNVKDFDDVKMATLIGWAEKYIGIRIAPGEDRYSVVKFKDAEINEANVAEHFFAKVSGDDEVQEILNAAWATRSNGEFQRELMAAYAMGLYQDTTHVLEAALEKVNGLDDKTLSRTVINFIGMKIIMFRRYRNLKAMQKNFDIKNLLVVEGEHGEKLNNLQKKYGVIDLFKTALFGQDVLAGYKDMPESWYADVHKAFKTIHEHLAEDGMMLFSPSMEEFNNLPLVKLFRLLGMEERLEEYSALYQDSQFVPEFNFAPKVDHQGRMLKEELFIANKEQVESVAKVYKKLKDIAEVYDTQTAWRVLNLTIGVPLYAQRNIGPEALLSEKIDILQLISQRYNNKFDCFSASVKSPYSHPKILCNGTWGVIMACCISRKNNFPL